MSHKKGWKGTEEDRFLSKVEKKEEGCWNWRGYKNKKGYGLFYKDGRKSVPPVKAHRYSYEVAKGKIPKGFFVCHSCDNPTCVNPQHLWVGTPKDNSQDMVKKKRFRVTVLKGENNGFSKLKSSDVVNIKRLLLLGKPQREIAAIFNVSKTNISSINRKKTWSHVTIDAAIERVQKRNKIPLTKPKKRIK